MDYSSAAIDSFIAESRALLLEAGIDISDAERLVTTDTNETIDLINITDDDSHNNVPTTSSEIICIDDSMYMPPARRPVSRIRENEVIDLCSPKSPKRSRINSDRKPVQFNMPAPTPVPKPKPVEPAPPQNVCPVCLDDYKKNCPTTTTCGHIFCGPCIRKCVQSYQKCPNCNKKLNMKQLIKIYI